MSAGRRKPVYSVDAPDQERLKVARVEIEAVLRRHDLAGVVVLHTPGMTEFFYDIRPSYSCAWIDEAASTLRLKSLAADYGGDVQTQLHDQAATANMMRGIFENMAGARDMFGYASALLDRATRAKHAPMKYVADAMEARKQ